MFGLFKKARKTRDILDWELFLIYKTIEKLPAEFQPLNEQVEYDLFVYATINSSTYDSDFIGFGYSKLINQFENRKERGYKITNIKVYDNKQNKYFVYTIDVYGGVITGYSIKNNPQPDIDLNTIDVSAYIKAYYENADYDRLKKILNSQEIELINSDEVYEVELDGKMYFHLKDLEDGNFIGIDRDKVIYKITHDPHEIKPLIWPLAEAMNSIE